MNLVPNQPMNTITLGESLYQVMLVLPDSLNGIRCDADIQGPPEGARETEGVREWRGDAEAQRNDGEVLGFAMSSFARM